MIKKVRYSVVVFLLFFSVIQHAQVKPLFFDFYTADDGLKSSQIKTIAQDSSGLIWFGRDMLCRFDGYDFKYFIHEEFDQNSLVHNTINSLHTDRNGILWIGTDGGVSRYDIRTHQFKNFTFSDSILDERILSIAEDKNGNLWFGTYKGVFLINTLTNKIINYSIQQDTSVGFNAAVMSLISVGNYIWAGTWKNGLYRIDIQNMELKSYSKIDDIDFLSKFKVNDLFLDSDSVLWIASDEYGLLKYNSIHDKLNRVQVTISGQPISISRCMSISQVDKNMLLIASAYPWMIQFNTLKNKADVFNSSTSNLMKPSSLLYRDRNYGLWAILGNEIAYCDLRNKKFINQSSDINEQSILNVKHLIGDKNNSIWALGNAGLYKSTFGTNNYSLVARESTQSSYRKILIGKDNRLFCWTNKSIEILHPNRQTISVSELIGKSDFIVDVVEDKRGALWFTSNDGIFTNAFSENSHFKSAYTSLDFLKNHVYPRVYVSADSFLIITTGSSLFKLDDAYQLQNTFDLSKLQSRKNEVVVLRKCIAKKNNLFVFATGSGIFFVSGDSVKPYLYEIYQIPETVNDMVLDDNDHLWIATSKCLVRFNIKNNAISKFYMQDGLNDNEIHSLLYYNETLFIGSRSGINLLRKDQMILDSNKIEPILISLGIFNIEVTPSSDGYIKESIAFLKSITLKHDESDITLRFSSLNFNKKKNIHYRYKLDGYDRDWIYSKNQNTAHYTNLSPGKYIFHVTCTNENMVWSTKERLLKIVILPPWWASWWFRITAILSTIGLIILIFRLRLRSLKERQVVLEMQVRERTSEIEMQKEELAQQSQVLQDVNSMLKERQDELEAASEELRAQSEELASTNEQLTNVNATKDKFFSIIAHDLKNPFQSIIGFSDMLINQVNTLAQSEIKEYSQMINQSAKSTYYLLQNLLEWARTQTRQVPCNPESLALFYQTMNTINILNLSALNKNILITNEIPEDIIVKADKNMLNTIIRNLISNAIKFTPEKGKITISACKIKDGFVEICINDSGVGMSDEIMEKIFSIGSHHTERGTGGEAGTGLGLVICREFANMNNGDIRVESEKGKGSRFYITLPAGNRQDVSTSEIEYSEPIVKTISIDPNKNILEDSDVELSMPTYIEPYKDRLILVIEDTENIRQNIVKSLKGFQILEASTGREGIEKAFEESPDLIISDIMMPEMDGYEVLKNIRIDMRTSHIPIVLLTSLESDANKIKGLEFGADDYIVKPFKQALLIARVVNLLKSRDELRMRFSFDPSTQVEQGNPREAEFVEKVIKLVESNIDNQNFSIEKHVSDFFMSKRTFDRKIKAISGVSTSIFIRNLRLNRALPLLLNTDYSISEIAIRMGFDSSSYFSRSFSEYYHVSPKEYREKNKK